MFTKARIVSDGTNVYLDVYYSQSYSNPFMFSAVNHRWGHEVYIDPVDFTPVAETADGETVRLSIDIKVIQSGSILTDGSTA